MAHAKYTQYVHEWRDRDGRTWWGVGEWDPAHNEYRWPLTRQDQKATGCHTGFCAIAPHLPPCGSRKLARNRARRWFGQQGE